MSSGVANLRLDHVPVLEGQSNYQQWERSMKLTMLGEDLWKYVSEGTVITNRAEFGILAPTLSETPTDTELTALDKFTASSVRAAAIIQRKLSPTVMMLVPRSIEQDPQAVWKHLRTQYDHADVNAQFAIMNHLEKVRLKDASDTQRYLAEFSNGFERLTNAGMNASENQHIYLVMKGLPDAGPWGLFRHTLQYQISEAANTSTPMTYLSIAEKIQTESRRQTGYPAYSQAGPGSEYANAARDTNAHRKNSSGTGCSVCGRNSHDKSRCWEKGGGVEGQKPAWIVMRDAECAARKSTKAN